MSPWLLDTLLATSALTLLVLVAREPVRRHFGSRVTYGLWLIPLARLFMPTLTETVERTVPAQPGVHILPAPVASESLWMAHVAPADPSLIERVGGWPILLLAGWLAVALALFVSRIAAFHRDRRAILADSNEIARIGSVRVVRSREVPSPVAFGIVDRVIAVPADFDRAYGGRERRLALEHELAHHRSGDLVANLIAFVLLCLQWFNPLAWVAHAAFRFDQEAACDARVLDKASPDDRADYGRTIARAASGRALLFASALDRRNHLHRRLKSMLRTPNRAQQLAGRSLVTIAIAAALPLTASHAIEYVDVPAPAAPAVRDAPAAQFVPAAASQTAAVQPAAAVAPARPVPPRAPRSFAGDLTINDDTIIIDGVTKRWDQLTPAEKARVRKAIAEARAGLANVHIDRDGIMRAVDSAARIDRAELRRNLAEARANVAEAMKNIDEHDALLRRSGEDPERLRANIRQSLESVNAMDFAAIDRSLASIDPGKIAASVAAAEEAMRSATADLDRLEARIRAEDR